MCLIKPAAMRFYEFWQSAKIRHHTNHNSYAGPPEFSLLSGLTLLWNTRSKL